MVHVHHENDVNSPLLYRDILFTALDSLDIRDLAFFKPLIHKANHLLLYIHGKYLSITNAFCHANRMIAAAGANISDVHAWFKSQVFYELLSIFFLLTF